LAFPYARVRWHTTTRTQHGVTTTTIYRPEQWRTTYILTELREETTTDRPAFYCAADSIPLCAGRWAETQFGDDDEGTVGLVMVHPNCRSVGFVSKEMPNHASIIAAAPYCARPMRRVSVRFAPICVDCICDFDCDCYWLPL
jgi:hypothetical protein